MKSIYPSCSHVLMANGRFKSLHTCKKGDLVISSQGVCSIKHIGLPTRRFAQGFKSSKWHSKSFALPRQLFAESKTSFQEIANIKHIDSLAFQIKMPQDDNINDYHAGYVYGVTQATGVKGTFVPISNADLLQKFKSHHVNYHGNDSIQCSEFSCNATIDEEKLETFLMTASFCQGVLDGIADNIKYNFNMQVSHTLYELIVFCKAAVGQSEENLIDTIDLSKSMIDTVILDVDGFLFCDNAWTCGELI